MNEKSINIHSNHVQKFESEENPSKLAPNLPSLEVEEFD